MNKKVFMFIYGDIVLGGVELILTRLIRKLISEGHRIIWLSTGNGVIEKSLEMDFSSNKINIYNVSLVDYKRNGNIDLSFNNEDEIVALSFDMQSFIILELIKKKQNRHARINTFFFVTHFQGLFFEKRVRKFQNVVKIFSRYFLKIMVKNRNLIFANISHIDSFQKNYKLKIMNKDQYLYKNYFKIIEFDEEKIARKFDLDYFNILTITRFDFPHKSYIFGLIKTFIELKKNYNKLILTIIGYGEGENQLMNYINQLDSISRDSINVVGKVSYDCLGHYFDSAHINVGVAGTIIDGALSGVISIPVRHYSESCETYGFLPSSKDQIVSDNPGYSVDSYIDKVLRLDRNDFVSLSKESYDTFNDSNDNIIDLLPYENIKNNKIFIDFILFCYKIYKSL